jgi:hypothetical protein
MTSTAATIGAARPQTAARTYAWTGDRDGVAHAGRTGLAPEEMAAKTEICYRRGWRELNVAEGWDPPSQAQELAAAIEPHPDTGRRIWWAAGADSAGAAPGMAAQREPAAGP